MATDHAESNGLHERFGLTSNIEREADGRPMLEADEELFSTFANVGLLLGGSSQGDGTLFVSTRRVIWTEAAAAPPPAGHAYSVPYPSIAMHAMSTALDPEQPAAAQRPCIYMQLDAGGPEVMRDDGGGEEDGDDEDDEGAAVPELHLVPADPTTLEAIFAALCECASKNPDPDQADDEGEFFFDEDEVRLADGVLRDLRNGSETSLHNAVVMAGAGAEGRAARLQHLDGLLQMPRPEDFDQMVGEDEGRFEDADEDEEDDVEGEAGQEQPRR